MSFFIPKDVVEKLREAEKINNATKDLEKINNIARQIAQDYSNQLEMFRAQMSRVQVEPEKISQTSSYQSFKNYEQELKDIYKIQKTVENIANTYDNIKNLQKYTEILNKASSELKAKNEMIKNIENIQKKYDLFESLKKASEEVNFHENFSSKVEQRKSNKHLMDFLRRINTHE